MQGRPHNPRPNLFLDIDGVLLGKSGLDSPAPALANHATEFLEFSLANFDCFWLTTHCQGDAATVVDYLRPYCTEAILLLIAQIRPTRFTTFKTETLFGDFLWLDDAPLATELDWLTARGLRDRWIEVNTRKRPDDLARAMELLKRRG